MPGQPATDRPHAEVVGRDRLPVVVPFTAAVVVAYAAVTDPASPARVALLVGAAALFAAWAIRPDRVPSLVLTVGVITAVVVAKGSGDLDVGLFLVSLLAIVVVGWEPSRPTLLTTAVLAAATPVLIDVLYPGDIDLGIWLLGVVFPGVMSWLFRRQEELRTQLEESRRRLAARAVSEERRRIARDVHDLVGHGLAAVLLQVAGARHVLRRDPDEADAALAAAEDSGRRSLSELRATVALLRADGDTAVSALPGLEHLTRLVDETRAAGLTVEHTTSGDLDRVHPMVALTLYRLAQEALLNASRHAASARTVVSIDVRDDQVELLVDSRPIRPVGSAGPGVRDRPGYGLIGMRERAAVVGGEFRAGPDADGWLVGCKVPIAGRPAGGAR